MIAFCHSLTPPFLALFLSLLLCLSVSHCHFSVSAPVFLSLCFSPTLSLYVSLCLTLSLRLSVCVRLYHSQIKRYNATLYIIKQYSMIYTACNVVIQFPILSVTEIFYTKHSFKTTLLNKK